MRILVTRPLPGGESTAARLRALGHDVLLAPLLVTEPLAWEPPPDAPEAVMLTSAAAVRHAGPAAARYHRGPAYVVGRATAAAARCAGYQDVRDGNGTAQAVLDTIAAAGITRILHIAGADRTLAIMPPGLDVTTVIVYRARLLPLTERSGFDWVVLYSARTAAHFATECDRLGLPRAEIAIAAISAHVRTAAGAGWADAVAADRPQEDALLAAIASAWQKRDA